MSYVLKRNGEQVAISGGWNPHLFASHTGTSYPASVGVDYEWAQDGWHLLWEPDAAPEVVPPTQEQIIAQYEAALDAHLDAVAQADRWTDRFTFAVRAGYPNPWQQKAIAFGTWMDTCNALAYDLMQKVAAGDTQLPTIGEFIASLPKFEG